MYISADSQFHATTLLEGLDFLKFWQNFWLKGSELKKNTRSCRSLRWDCTRLSMSIRNFFSLCFSYGGISFFDGHIFSLNQDIELFFLYKSAYGYFSPCEGFYRVSSTPLFFILPVKVAHSINGARRWVHRHFVLAEKSAAISRNMSRALIHPRQKGNSVPGAKFIPLSILIFYCPKNLKITFFLNAHIF